MAKPEEKVTPEQVLKEFEYLKNQAESYQNNLKYVGTTISEMSIVIESLNEIQSLKKKNELLVPLGSGAFISAEVKDREKVILNIGSDVSVKKEIGEGIEFLKSRTEELGEAYNKISGKIQQIHQRLEMISPIVEEIMASAQGSPGDISPR